MLQEKIGMLKTVGERLKYLPSHDAIILLRHSFSIPKLLYTLRTSPCFLSLQLLEYDNLLRSIVSGIVDIHFNEDDPTCTKATLPVKNRGLEIRSAVQPALSLFQLLPALNWFAISSLHRSRVYTLSGRGQDNVVPGP